MAPQQPAAAPSSILGRLTNHCGVRVTLVDQRSLSIHPKAPETAEISTPPATLNGFDQNWAIHHMMSKRNQCPATIFPAFCNLKKKNKKRKRMCPSDARTASGGGS